MTLVADDISRGAAPRPLLDLRDVLHWVPFPQELTETADIIAAILDGNPEVPAPRDPEALYNAHGERVAYGVTLVEMLYAHSALRENAEKGKSAARAARHEFARNLRRFEGVRLVLARFGTDERLLYGAVLDDDLRLIAQIDRRSDGGWLSADIVRCALEELRQPDALLATARELAR